MTRILLIRHGTTDAMRTTLCGRTPGVHLNESGVTHVRGIGRRLQGISDLQAVYAGPLDRAIETAAEIATAQGLEVTVDAGWNEVDFGSWQGCSFAELEQQEEWRNFNRYRSMNQPPNGESMLAVQTRTLKALEAILSKHSGATVAVVTHCDIIRGLLLVLLGMSADYIFRLDVGAGSVTTLSAGKGVAPVLHCFNEQAQL